jgi:hypothetical protein
MSKELRITATMLVPDDALGQSKIIAKLEPHIEAMKEALGGEVEMKIVTPSGPRKKAETAPPAAAHPHTKAA